MGTWSQSKIATYGAVQPLQRAVDVAGLGVLVVVARHVADAGLFGERAELLALAIIQDVDVQLVRRPVDIHRRQRRVTHHAQRLVVGRDQQVDLRPLVRIFRQRHRRAAQRPQRLHDSRGTES